SDIALKKPLPPDLAQDVLAYVGCVAGAISFDDYTRWLEEAGFAAVQVVDTGKDLNAYAPVEGQAGCRAPPAGSPTPLRAARGPPALPAPGGQLQRPLGAARVGRPRRPGRAAAEVRR